MSKAKTKKSANLARALMKWFRLKARDLPWRQNQSNTYQVWLSEIMLQQTQVETVIPYYNRFLKNWPTVSKLADASEDEVMKNWEGLGYYSRARNLHRCAQSVVMDHDGIFPGSKNELLELPGIGPYSAGAIASIAFGERVCAIDGNVRRVVSRLMAKNLIEATPKNDQIISRFLLTHMPNQYPGQFNEALMELGATTCRPKSPNCTDCPIKKYCEANLQNVVAQYPKKKKKPKVKKVEVGIAVIEHRKRYLLQKNTHRGLLSGLWHFPYVEINGRSEKQIGSEVTNKIRAQIGINIEIEKTLDPFQHRFTHILMTLKPFTCKFKKANIKQKSDHTLKWVNKKQLQELALSKAHRKLADQI